LGTRDLDGEDYMYRYLFLATFHISGISFTEYSKRRILGVDENAISAVMLRLELYKLP
jgi:hypothetical protein